MHRHATPACASLFAAIAALAVAPSCSPAVGTEGFGDGGGGNASSSGGASASGSSSSSGSGSSSGAGNGSTSSGSAAGSSSGAGGSTSSSGSSGAGASSSSGSGSSSGARPGSSSSGGTASSSSGSGAGSSSSGGASSSGVVDAGGAAGDGGFDPTEVTRVAGWLANAGTNGLSMSLNNGTAGPSGASANITKYFPIGATRDRLVDSIVGACAAFAPRLPSWTLYCEAIIASAIVSESTYNPTEDVNDSYSMTHGGGMDPTVGLIQIRFSSTVHDYNYYGPLPTIAAIGCAWPTNLAALASNDASWNDTGANYLSFMEDPACNVPLATWYYFQNATGNGGATAVYAAQYCAGQGIAGTMVVGLLSHLLGPAFPRPADPTNAYPAGIDFRFNTLIGQAQANPSAQFAQTLQPSVAQYCAP